ncbi:MAG: hypothetical protein GY928_05305 [Colwellia sp.]|nr:hypothetical protein [Colwellia sp.]
MKWEKLQKHISRDVAEVLESHLNSKAMFPSIILDSQDELAISIKDKNVIVDGSNIIRLIREIIHFDAADIISNSVYEFIPSVDREEEIKLEGDPSDYYNLQIECKHCGRYKWIQNSDLKLNNSTMFDIDETESGEILISGKLKNVFVNEQLRGFSFRKIVDEENVWQLFPENQVTVKSPNKYVKEKDICSFCGKPRIIIYEDSNGIELFKPPFDIPRIERTPTLLLQNMPGDFSVTNTEFGTLGRLPEGSPDVAAEEFSHKTSKPKWVMSGRMCKILYREKVKGFELSHAKLC